MTIINKTKIEMKDNSQTLFNLQAKSEVYLNLVDYLLDTEASREDIQLLVRDIKEINKSIEENF